MQVSLEKIFPLNTNFNFHFIVLGCGGTGSAFIPRLCALLSTMPPGHIISIFDADKVEEKNLSRQGFFAPDLNKNKAEVLGMKCNTAYNVGVVSYPRYIETKEELAEICNLHIGYVPFIIGCVDTNAVRKMIHNYVEFCDHKLFWLDSGNEEFVGQVVLYHKPNTTSTNINQIGGSDRYSFTLPDVTYFFPDMLESNDEFASKISCAEHAVSHPQAAITNITAATILLQFVAACLDEEICFHKVTFDAQRATYNTLFNYESLLLKYGNTLTPAMRKRIKRGPTVIKPQTKAVAHEATLEQDEIVEAIVAIYGGNTMIEATETIGTPLNIPDRLEEDDQNGIPLNTNDLQGF